MKSKGIKSLILNILENIPETRSCDNLLIKEVLKSKCSKFEQEIIEDIFKDIDFSISNIAKERAKIQNDFKLYPCNITIQEKRKLNQEIMRIKYKRDNSFLQNLFHLFTKY